MPELLPGVGSDVVELANAELVTARDAMLEFAGSVLTVTVTVADPAAAIVPGMHVMLVDVVAHAPWDVVYEATVSPLGRPSVNVAAWASLGPLFETVIV